MEQTRIRYNTPVNGRSKSRQFFSLPNGKTFLYVILDFNTFTFEVLNASNDNVVVSGGNTKNKAVLKQQAKKALEKLGVKFSEEERPSRRLSASKRDEAQVEN